MQNTILIILELITSLTINIINTFAFYKLFEKFFEKKSLPFFLSPHLFFQISILVPCGILYYLIPIENPLRILIVPIYLIAPIVCFKNSVFDKIIILCLFVTIPNIISNFLLFLASYINNPIDPHSIPTVLICRFLFCPIIFYPAYKLTLIFFSFIRAFDFKMKLIILLYIGCQYAICLLLQYSIVPIHSHFYTPVLIVWLSIFTIITCFLLWYIYYISLMEQKKLRLKQKNNFLMKQQEQLSKEKKRYSKLRHDIANHLVTIHILLENKDFESAKKYYEELNHFHDNS